MSLLLPTDGCERCLTAECSYPIHPYRVDVMPAEDAGKPQVKAGGWLRAWYRCSRCIYSWRTAWSLDAASLPCPGCALCQPRSGAA